MNAVKFKQERSFVNHIVLTHTTLTVFVMVTTCRYCGGDISGTMTPCPAMFNPSDFLRLYLTTDIMYDTVLWSYVGTGFALQEGVTANGVTSDMLTGMHCMPSTFSDDYDYVC